MSTWPQQLQPVRGPFSAERIDGAVAGMGDYGPSTRSIVSSGLVQPDLLTGLTLLLLARQPRQAPAAASDGPTEPDGGAVSAHSAKGDPASPIAGGVWVRERFTIHRPLDRDDPFTVGGVNTGRHVHKGRRYATTMSTTTDSEGRLVATNLTTGLVAYKAVEGLADEVEGLPVAGTPGPLADAVAAAANPCGDALRAATVGTRLGGDPVVVSLAMMAARDTSSPDNPIHSDLEAAKAAGLDRPIAGGSHVQAFALEPILAEFGPEVLFHGAHLDTRWKAPTKSDTTIVPTATIRRADDERVVLDVEVTLADDENRQAMIGTVEIPVPTKANSHS